MSRLHANALLVFIALVMGSTFVVVKQAVAEIDPLTFLAYRFVIASAAVGIAFRSKLHRLSKQDWLIGSTIGLWLTAGFLLQTIGLTSTTASKAGFITGLCVVLVPIISAVWLKRPPKPSAALGVLSAAIGMGFLCLGDSLRPAIGDLFVLGCAFAFAMHITCIGEAMKKANAMNISIIQLFVTGVACGLGALTAGSTPTTVVLQHAEAIIFMALVPSALVLSLQVYVQRFVSATNTALVLSLEPVFAAMFGSIVLGEILTAKAMFGACLILIGMIIAEVKLPIFSSASRRASYTG